MYRYMYVLTYIHTYINKHTHIYIAYHSTYDLLIVTILSHKFFLKNYVKSK